MFPIPSLQVAGIPPFPKATGKIVDGDMHPFHSHRHQEQAVSTIKRSNNYEIILENQG